MLDAASPSDLIGTHQRASGELRVSLKRRGAATVLDDFFQSGCLKARLPRPERGGWTSVVTLNTSGGIAGGDRMSSLFEARPQTSATIAGQAAERHYRVLPDTPSSTIRTTIRVAEGARLEWLPQETILFDRSALDRVLTIELAEDFSFLGVETLVFGRAAMGETVERIGLRDTIRLRCGGRLVLHDAIRLDGPARAILSSPATGGGASAIANLLYAVPDAEDWTDRLRAALPGDVEAGVSAWDGMLVARLLAHDARLLRRAIVAGLAVLRGDRPLPRVWLC